jgi:hypothetical protein
MIMISRILIAATFSFPTEVRDRTQRGPGGGAGSGAATLRSDRSGTATCAVAPMLAHACRVASWAFVNLRHISVMIARAAALTDLDCSKRCPSKCRFQPLLTTISRSPSAARRSSPSSALLARPSSRCATSSQV